ncbi:TadE/TadG family type IV pilus assembly protein [Bythopirellula polymerisocia]|uniref:TadE-like protein n=1 Tax=Bythopirellula polymerisocia TaxID=2528003 RepID=A0A5C6CDM4_9BACT|nr:TadE/TadG family type IV pilus assembly protein [Bythopirellula polymerisocia]TWU22690.1 TadE-like protein [Bythopirellula polymerisocia]
MFIHRRRARQAGFPQSHRGVAATELALVLPLFVMLVMASIEACNMVFLNHSLSIASYEAVRVAINFDSTNTAVEQRFDTLIAARNVSGAALSISPANVATTPRGTQISLTATAPCDSNALIPPWFFGGRTLSVTTTMVKE